MEKRWVIAGGGIHGLAACVHLVRSGTARVEEIMVIDPEEDYLMSWERKAQRTGMTHLRSPSVHHLDQDPFSLQKYAHEQEMNRHLKGRYKRPSLALFGQHAEWLITSLGLRRAYRQDDVRGLLRKKGGGYTVRTAKGAVIRCGHVIVATGMLHRASWPEWAKKINRVSPGKVQHLLSSHDYDPAQVKPPVLVVGGGISASQTALLWSTVYPGEVTLLRRSSPDLSDFDSDPGWLGPKYMNRFVQEADPVKRHLMIQEARRTGSLPGFLHRELMRSQAEGRLTIRQGEVSSVCMKGGEMAYQCDVEDAGSCGSVILATGYEPGVPVPDWLESYSLRHGLPLSPNNTPLPDTNLMWDESLFLTGPLAELILGPTSRNIAGARKAASLIVAATKAEDPEEAVSV
ncbi:FAD/NAD(P)-binding protein [Salisediminibacterium selenitireducens]|uniref:Flavoprotein involved in K+ transport-like protein n=1 Tax=Bacillus selenitireducens (strain ATCC 700615 / DSM 15326 / MLS10) TaxID=439292 RepID=D6XYV2_BACIE|nr:FAD/NAD(P)-binding protein [Salisediminibacterium selenitireducens]ADH98260.1 flavoprotein involved in K+ transport-like protein [[Bacillus] selenitireducens MLS10]